MIVAYQCTNYIGDALVVVGKMEKKIRREVASLFRLVFAVDCKNEPVGSSFTVVGIASFTGMYP